MSLELVISDELCIKSKKYDCINIVRKLKILHNQDWFGPVSSHILPAEIVYLYDVFRYILLGVEIVIIPYLSRLDGLCL